MPGTRKGGVERDRVGSGLWPREELLGLRVGAVVVTRVLSVSWFDHEITRAGGRPRELPVFRGEFGLGVINGGGGGGGDGVGVDDGWVKLRLL